MKTNTHYWHPRYWPTWLALAILRITIYLPSHLRILLGRALGNLLFMVAKRRRHITQVNIRLCFPELTPKQQHRLVQQVFQENAIGLLETAQSFWAPIESFKSQVVFKNIQALKTAVAAGKGVLLIGAHYTTLDLGGLLFSLFFPLDVMYRPHDNPLFDAVLRKARARWAHAVIPRNNMRAIFRSLKQGHIFWYPADQDYGEHLSVFAPFFGIPAATLETTARLAQVNHSPVLIIGHHRLPDHSYVLSVSDPLTHYPSGHAVNDATQVNAEIEKQIRRFPAQYMWVHRRFKTRGEGEPDRYGE